MSGRSVSNRSFGPTNMGPSGFLGQVKQPAKQVAPLDDPAQVEAAPESETKAPSTITLDVPDATEAE